MSTSVQNMIDLIRDCRGRNHDFGPRFSTATISDICNHIKLPFLIEPLTKTGRSEKPDITIEKAFEQLRSFGPGTGEFYFAETMQPSIVNIVAHKSARAKWIHQLILEGESQTDAIARVVDLWDVPDNVPDLERLTVKREYELWLRQQHKPLSRV
jgi:hypothetical protein